MSLAHAFVHKYMSNVEYVLNKEHVDEICHDYAGNKDVLECHNIPLPFPINSTHYIYITAGNEYMVDNKLFAVSRTSNAYVFKHKDETKISTFLKGLYAME